MDENRPQNEELSRSQLPTNENAETTVETTKPEEQTPKTPEEFQQPEVSSSTNGHYQIRNSGQRVNNSHDNGMYTTIEVEGKTKGSFLVDSGSQVTLMSISMYEKLDKRDLPAMRENNVPLLAVNGQQLRQHGTCIMNITLGHSHYKHTIIVCDLPIDGLLGQDFLMTHVKQIDFKKLKLHLDTEIVSCWIGGQDAMTCQVQATNTTSLPAHSVRWISVKIPERQHLAETVLIEPISTLVRNRGVILLPAVSENKDCIVSKIINVTDMDITLYPNQQLGKCESAYEGKHQEVRNVNTSSEGRETTKVPPHLKELISNSSAHLDQDQIKELTKLLIKYQHVFAKSSDDMGRTTEAEHNIDTKEAKPFRIPPRRQPAALAEAEREEIKKMLERNVIEPSSSSWSSPVTLIRKKDGSIRFCVDYRRLNEITVSDAYPLPRTEDCLDALAGNCWFSTMDLQSGFWQVPLAEASKEKTAFSTKMGLFHFNVLPFGLSNSPACFERLMEKVLKGLQWEECLLFVDDTIVPSKTFEEGIERLEHVLQRFSQANLKLKPTKCNLFQKRIKFLGHVVSKDGTETDPEKIVAVRNWPVPKSAKQVRSFIGLCTYYRKYVKDFSKIAKPLHQLCEKNRRFDWTDECQAAFEILKEKLTTSPILAFPLPNLPFILDTDASDQAVGAVLSQVQEGKERVIAYLSKSLITAEQNYCVTRRELLAVVTALRKFHSYLYGQKVLLRTDNSAVSWMKSLKNPSGQTARWLQELETYDLVITHRAGRQHSNADALSRKPCVSCQRQQERNTEHLRNSAADEVAETPDAKSNTEDTINTKEQTSQHDCQANERLKCSSDIEVGRLPTDVKNRNRVAVVTNDDQNPMCSHSLDTNQEPQVKFHPMAPEGWNPGTMRKAQLEDSDIEPILRAKEESTTRPRWGDVSTLKAFTKTLWAQWERLTVIDGVLYRKRMEKESDFQIQMIVPQSKRETILKYHHDIPTAGHLGAEKTSERIKQSYYWPGMDASIKKYCVQCDTCTARKASPVQNKAPLGHCGAGEPLERVAIDICGPFPLTDMGNRYIMVLTDQFTRWTEAIPIPNQEAKTVAQAFITHFASRFGYPLTIFTDQGTNFESNLFKEMCDILGIDKARTTSMRPQANGMVERFNRTLAIMMTAYCENNQKRWDVYLPLLASAYRSSAHGSTGVTPNMLMLGREVDLPLSLVVGRPRDTEVTADEFVSELQKKFQEVHELARKHVKKNMTYQKRYYDLRAKRRAFEPGQAVWLYNPTRKIRVCHKLTTRWKGPYMITKRVDDLTYLVKRRMKEEAKAYHIDRLLLYRGNNTPAWIVKMRETTRIPQ